MENIIAFAVLAGLLTIFPGPDTFLVLRSSVSGGVKSGFASSLGIVTGLIMWAVASAVGIAAILVASQDLFRALQFAGAVYLLWLGVQSLRSGMRSDKRQLATAITVHSPVEAFRTGLMSNLLNPKVGMFFLVVFPPFLPEGGNVFAWSIGLAGLLLVETVLWLGLIVIIAERARYWLVNPRVTGILECIAGTALLLFGARILFALRKSVR